MLHAYALDRDTMLVSICMASEDRKKVLPIPSHSFSFLPMMLVYYAGIHTDPWLSRWLTPEAFSNSARSHGLFEEVVQAHGPLASVLYIATRGFEQILPAPEPSIGRDDQLYKKVIYAFLSPLSPLSFLRSALPCFASIDWQK